MGFPVTLLTNSLVDHHLGMWETQFHIISNDSSMIIHIVPQIHWILFPTWRFLKMVVPVNPPLFFGFSIKKNIQLLGLPHEYWWHSPPAASRHSEANEERRHLLFSQGAIPVGIIPCSVQATSAESPRISQRTLVFLFQLSGIET